MATIAIPKVLLREPRLLTPGQRPVGQVRIDKSNPITEGLVLCSLANNRRNLVDNRYPDEENAATSLGEYEYFDGVNNHRSYNYSSPVGISADSPHTFFLIAEPLITGTLKTAIAIGSSSSTYSMLEFSTSQIRFRAGTTTNVPVTTTIPTGYITCAAVLYTSNDAKLYVNNNVYSNTGAMTLTSTVNRNFAVGRIPWNLTKYNGEMNFKFGCIFSRALSESEIRSLIADPYQFFIPA